MSNEAFVNLYNTCEFRRIMNISHPYDSTFSEAFIESPHNLLANFIPIFSQNRYSLGYINTFSKIFNTDKEPDVNGYTAFVYTHELLKILTLFCTFNISLTIDSVTKYTLLS